MSQDFYMAHERARSRVGDHAWSAMSQHDRATAIYKELRALDAERITARPKDDLEHKGDILPPGDVPLDK
jgi:hypothetical protein